MLSLMLLIVQQDITKYILLNKQDESKLFYFQESASEQSYTVWDNQRP